MKKHTFTLLIGWLLLMTSNLMAQNTEGRFKLKEGDWFEVAVEQNNCDNGIANYLLRYQLLKQLPNNNQQYQIILENHKEIHGKNMEYSGYDSYYPTFE